MIKDIHIDQMTASFEGVCRVRHPRWRKTKRGADYLSAVLEDASGSVTAYAWEGKYRGPRNLADLDRIRIVATSRAFNGSPICDILKLEHSSEGNPLDLVPSSLGTNSEQLNALVEIAERLTLEPLRRFVKRFMNDDKLLLPFLKVPASGRHHHSDLTGLLRHSIECAVMVEAVPMLHGPVRELAIVAALMHDIGKVRCFDMDGRRTIAGHVLGHDDFTLELLASHLSFLDTDWPDGGMALRNLLTWHSGKRMPSRPLITAAEVVVCADRLSSGLDGEQQVFNNAPDWQRFAKLAPNTRYWRPRLEMNG